MTQLITIDNADPTIANAQDIALLGFKMAVNEGLTVFNLVDGVVDEFHDESGNDESESSNDTYCSSNDNYINTSSTAYSAGFGYNARTEPDTSNPGTNTYSVGTYTVPSGMTSAVVKLWGAGGSSCNATPTGEHTDGGGGGYTTGTTAVTGEQVVQVAIGTSGFPTNEPNASVAGEGGKGFRQAGDTGAISPAGTSHGGGGGGGSGVFIAPAPAATPYPQMSAPNVLLIAGGGGGAGYAAPEAEEVPAGAGGGLVGEAGGGGGSQNALNGASGGGGDQEAGGVGGASVNPPPDGNPGGFLAGGYGAPTAAPTGGGGEGYYGGGGAGVRGPSPGDDFRTGGGGSSYYGHPQVTSGSTEAGNEITAGGATQPGAVAESTGAGGNNTCASERGGAENGYVLITGCSAVTSTTNIISNAFTASSAPSTARIVVFQETVSSYTLNTDLIASVSRDGGTTFTTATLADTGYVTGTSGQRILTGTATVSGQPSGTAMRWKLALANNQSKIHGVSLQWK